MIILKKISLLIFGILLFTACEEEFPTNAFIDGQVVVDNRPETDTNDPNPTNPTPPVTGFAAEGDVIADVADEEFILADFSAILRENRLFISFTSDTGKILEMTVPNPETRRYDLNNDPDDFLGVVITEGKVYRTDSAATPVGTLDLNYDGNTVSGQFFFVPFFSPPGTVTATEFLPVDEGQFKNIEVEMQ